MIKGDVDKMLKSIKSDASVEELENVITYLRGEIARRKLAKSKQDESLRKGLKTMFGGD